MSEKKRGRPPKSLRLDPLKEVKRGTELRNVRDTAQEQKESVLQTPSQSQAPRNETVGVFAKPADSNSGRGSGPSNIPLDSDIRLSILIRKILAEPAADEFQDGDGPRLSNAESLARLLVRRALSENQFAIEAVLDRAEGKPVKGQTVSLPDMTVEDMISQQEVALLNNELKKEKE